MALLPFDELNTPKVEVEPPEKYFSKMAISKEQKEERVETANDLMDVLLFFFALLAIEMQEVQPDYDMVYRKFKTRFRNVVADHSRMDDYQNNYVDEYTLQQYELTRRHMEAAGVGSGNTDAGWWTSADRAMAIGENEANSILNYSELQKAIDEGYTTKTWVTERDNRVRKTHKEVDGVTIPIKEYFIVGNGVMLAPHDEYNNPDECVNCRCSLKFSKGSSDTERLYYRVRSYDYPPKFERDVSLDEITTKDQLLEKFPTVHFTQAFFKLDPNVRKEIVQGLNYMKNRFGEDSLPKTLTTSLQEESYGITDIPKARVSMATTVDVNNAFATTCHECMHVYDGRKHMISERIVPDTKKSLSLNVKEYDKEILDILGARWYTLYCKSNTEILACAFEEVLYGTDNKFAIELINKLGK